jgi:hypothetical protein
MVLKNIFIATVCAVFLGWSGLASADQYQPDQFLGLDLSKAVLSPKPLGPATEFAPVAVEAKTDAKTDHVGEAAQARAEPKADPKITIPRTRVAHRAEPPRGAARTRLARRQGNRQGNSHGNPLDAEAFDTRIQVWPCKSGGICNWQH